MFSKLIETCTQAVEAAHGDYHIGNIQTIADALTPVIHQFEVTRNDLPWGRYLIHHHPDDLYNIQLDIFSSDYTGSAHAHGAWGAFWLLKGTLRAWDYQWVDGQPVLARYGQFQPGSAQCFCPPLSDWHKVGTPAGQEQTVSIHIYGQGFDMDVGTALNAEGEVHQYRRGAWGDLDKVLPHIQLRRLAK